MQFVPYQASTMDSLATMVDDLKQLTVVAKLSILDVWRYPDYSSAAYSFQSILVRIMFTAFW